MDIKQKLYWLAQAGISVFCTETPHFNSKESPVLSPKSDIIPATQQAQTYAIQAKDLDELNKEKGEFSLSSLKKTAAHTLFGVGPLTPDLMCIIESPDSDADKQGISFAGEQGELLKKMLTAIHLEFAKNVYVTYLSPWRTPGNRPLTQSERNLFLPFLDREIQFVQPKKILLFGAGLADVLLQISSLSKARGLWHHRNNTPVRVTLSLGAIKTTPQRQQAWADLQEVEKLI